MPKKTAKEIVTEVVNNVSEQVPTKKKAASKIEEIQIPVEHHRLCMVLVSPGSACNCPESLKR